MPTAAGLYYFAHGAADAERPPVILIHGAGGHHLSWPPEVRRLPDLRVLAVDLPGHGKSAGVGHQTIDDYASGILDFLKALNLNQAVLIGHSMGGAIAFQAAAQAPKTAIGLGLVGSASRLRVSPALLQLAADPLKEPEVVHRAIEYSFAPSTNPRLTELIEQRMLGTRSSVLYGDFLACDAFEGDPSRITVPTLILFGELDHMVSPGAGRALQEQIPGSRFELVSGGGHMVMLEQPVPVADLLADFTSTITYQPGK